MKKIFLGLACLAGFQTLSYANPSPYLSLDVGLGGLSSFSNGTTAVVNGTTYTAQMSGTSKSGLYYHAGLGAMLAQTGHFTWGVELGYGRGPVRKSPITLLKSDGTTTGGDNFSFSSYAIDVMAVSHFHLTPSTMLILKAGEASVYERISDTTLSTSSDTRALHPKVVLGLAYSMSESVDLELKGGYVFGNSKTKQFASYINNTIETAPINSVSIGFTFHF